MDSEPSSTPRPSKPIPPPDLKKPEAAPPPPPAAMSKASPPPSAAASPAAGEPPPRVRVSENPVATAGDERQANLNPRLLAALIDFLIAFGLYLAVVLVFPGFLDFLATPVALAYLLTRDALPFLQGQSVGKRAMKLRAVGPDDRPLTGDWKSSALRNVPWAVPIFPLVELILLLTREGKPEQGLRLGDEWAKTRVIHAEDPAAETDGDEAA